MATNNAVNSPLAGTTGTGNFVGSSNPGIISPKITTGINDVNNNTMIGFTPTASAVNYIDITNSAASGGPPKIKATGSDSSVNLQFQSKNGTFFFSDATNTIAAGIRLFNAAGTFGTSLACSNSIAGNVSFTLPVADGSANYIMKTNGAGQLSLTTTAQLAGSPDGTSANAGNLGEVITSTVSSGSAVSLTTDVQANVTSISLTAGDWEVTGVIGFNIGGSSTKLMGGISSTSASMPSDFYRTLLTYTAGTMTTQVSLPIVPRRIVTGTTATVYLVALSTFSTSTMTAYGSIEARRMR